MLKSFPKKLYIILLTSLTLILTLSPAYAVSENAYTLTQTSEAFSDHAIVTVAYERANESAIIDEIKLKDPTLESALADDPTNAALQTAANNASTFISKIGDAASGEYKFKVYGNLTYTVEVVYTITTPALDEVAIVEPQVPETSDFETNTEQEVIPEDSASLENQEADEITLFSKSSEVITKSLFDEIKVAETGDLTQTSTHAVTGIKYITFNFLNSATTANITQNDTQVTVIAEKIRLSANPSTYLSRLHVNDRPTIEVTGITIPNASSPTEGTEAEYIATAAGAYNFTINYTFNGDPTTLVASASTNLPNIGAIVTPSGDNFPFNVNISVIPGEQDAEISINYRANENSTKVIKNIQIFDPKFDRTVTTTAKTALDAAKKALADYIEANEETLNKLEEKLETANQELTAANTALEGLGDTAGEEELTTAQNRVDAAQAEVNRINEIKDQHQVLTTNQNNANRDLQIATKATFIQKTGDGSSGTYRYTVYGNIDYEIVFTYGDAPTSSSSTEESADSTHTITQRVSGIKYISVVENQRQSSHTSGSGAESTTVLAENLAVRVSPSSFINRLHVDDRPTIVVSKITITNPDNTSTETNESTANINAIVSGDYRFTVEYTINETSETHVVTLSTTIDNLNTTLTSFGDLTTTTSTANGEEAITITSYNGTATDINIAASYNDIPVKSISANSFSNKGLTSLTLPEGLLTIGSGAFRQNSLTSLTIPSTVTSIGTNAFQRNQIANLSIVGTDADLTFEGNALSNNLLTSLSINNANSLTFETNVFSDNDITSINLSTTESITFNQNLGNKNNLLNSLSLTSKNISIDSTFIGTGATPKPLSTLSLNASENLIIKNAFENTNLSTITINSPKNTEITNGAFRNTNLTSLSISGENISIGKENTFNEIFRGSTITSATLEASNDLEIGAGAFFNKNIDTITLGVGNDLKIGSQAFSGTDLTSFTVTDANDISIGRQAFSGTDLTSFTVADANNISIGSQAFYSSTKLGDLDSLSLNASNDITVNSFAFYNNPAIETVSIVSESGLLDIKAGAFSRGATTSSSALNEVTLKGAKSITIGEDAFRNTTVLNDVTIEIDDSTTRSAFTSRNAIIKKIIVDNFAFRGAPITSLTLGGADEYEFGDGAFANNQITTLTLPLGTKIIGSQAFFSNTIDTINLPQGVKTVSGLAFAGYQSLATINVNERESESEIDDNSPWGANHASSTIKITKDEVNWLPEPVITPPTGGGGSRLNTVTFVTNGGSPVSPITSIPSGRTVTLSDVSTRDGYKFLGWYTSLALTGSPVTSLTVSRDRTVYAKWEKHPEVVEPVEPTNPNPTEPTEPEITPPEPVNPEITPEPDPDIVRPAFGDGIAMIVMPSILVLLVLGFFIFFIIIKRRKDKEEEEETEDIQ